MQVQGAAQPVIRIDINGKMVSLEYSFVLTGIAKLPRCPVRLPFHPDYPGQRQQVLQGSLEKLDRCLLLLGQVGEIGQPSFKRCADIKQRPGPELRQAAETCLGGQQPADDEQKQCNDDKRLHQCDKVFSSSGIHVKRFHQCNNVFSSSHG